MGMMDMMLNSLSKEKKEQMMIDMMPLMMEGMDINDLMPKMMANMFKDVTAEDVVKYLEKTINDNEKLQEISSQLVEANLMTKMMMKKYPSKLSFEETVSALEESIPQNNWKIPDTRDLTKLWQEDGIQDAPKIKILYLCNAEGGYKITRKDDMMPMTVMMPLGLSIYETSEGKVEVAFMNLGMMSMMYGGLTGEVLKTSAANLSNAIQVVLS